MLLSTVLPVMISLTPSAPMLSFTGAALFAEQSAMTVAAGSLAAPGFGSALQPSQMALPAICVNVFPCTRLSSLPYSTFSPMAPRSSKVLPLKVTLPAAAGTALAAGSLNAPHGQEPAVGVAKEHSP